MASDTPAPADTPLQPIEAVASLLTERIDRLVDRHKAALDFIDKHIRSGDAPPPADCASLMKIDIERATLLFGCSSEMKDAVCEMMVKAGTPGFMPQWRALILCKAFDPPAGYFISIKGNGIMRMPHLMRAFWFVTKCCEVESCPERLTLATDHMVFSVMATTTEYYQELYHCTNKLCDHEFTYFIFDTPAYKSFWAAASEEKRCDFMANMKETIDIAVDWAKIFDRLTFKSKSRHIPFLRKIMQIVKNIAAGDCERGQLMLKYAAARELLKCPRAAKKQKTV